MCYEDEDITLLDRGYKILQKKRGFRFSVDAVIVADFFNPAKGGKILDIGTGNGIIPILLARDKKNLSIEGIEILEENVELAKRNIKLNDLEEQITIVQGDVKEYQRGNTFDYIISNPPYMKLNGAKHNENEGKSIARHEIRLDLEGLVKSAKRLLKPVGSLTLVHRSYRFSEISRVLEDSGFSLKRVKFVYFSPDTNSNLVLVEAWKGKKYKLEIEPPLFLNEKGY